MDGPKALLTGREGATLVHRTPSMNEVLAAIEKGDVKAVLRVLEAEAIHDTFLPTFALIEAAERGKLDNKGFRSILNCGADLQDAIESANREGYYRAAAYFLHRVPKAEGGHAIQQQPASSNHTRVDDTPADQEDNTEDAYYTPSEKGASAREERGFIDTEGTSDMSVPDGTSLCSLPPLADNARELLAKIIHRSKAEVKALGPLVCLKCTKEGAGGKAGSSLAPTFMITPCSHVFHYSCLMGAVQYRQVNGGEGGCEDCPECRAIIFGVVPKVESNFKNVSSSSPGRRRRTQGSWWSCCKTWCFCSPHRPREAPAVNPMPSAVVERK